MKPGRPFISQIEWTPAVYALILMNLIPIGGAIFFGWDAGIIIFLYWLENVVIGILNIPKLLTAQGTDGAAVSATGIFKLAGGLFLCAFFAVHYGMFCVGHYAFLKASFDQVPSFAEIFSRGDILIALGGLAVSHIISMFVNFYGKGEYKRRSPNAQMFLPYSRIVILHVVIIFGGFFTMMPGSGLISLILLVVIKTVVDLAAHIAEHKFAAKEMAT